MSGYDHDRQELATFGFPSLRRRWKLILACTLLAFLSGLFFAVLRPASYMATTQLLVYVKEVQTAPELIISLGRADLTQVENESELIRSRGTLAKVVHALHLSDDPEFAPAMTLPRGIVQWLFGASRATDDDSRDRQELAVESLARHVAVERVGTSHTIRVNVTSSDPEKSARIAKAISRTRSAEPEGDRAPFLRERLQGLGPSVYVMTPALAPTKPNGPRKILVILGAAMAGFVIGSALALLLDFRNRTIRSIAQVEHFGFECIGAIPLLKRRRATMPGRARSGAEPGGGVEFLPDPMLNRTLLRTTVAIEAAKARSIGIAAAVAGEGASTVARHLAHMAARSGRKVLLVQLDRSEARRSATGEAPFGPSSSDPQPLGSSLRSGMGVGPDILETAAPSAGDSGANWWMQCDQTALAAYDLIVVGLPPLERGPEFRMAAQNIDGILLVMKWGGADMERIERAFAVSGAVPTDFIGAVLNMMDDRMIGRFGDKLWEAEAVLDARRRRFSPAMSIEPALG